MTHSAHIRLIRWGHILGFFDHLNEIGAPISAGLARAGLPTLCEDPGVFVPLERTWAFWDRVARSDDPLLGWNVGRNSGFSRFSPELSHEIQRAPSLYQALQSVTRLIGAESSHLQLGIVEREHDILFATSYPDMRAAPGYAVSQSYQIEVYLSVIRHFLGMSWYPDEIGIEQTEVSQQLQDHLGGARITPNSRMGYLSVPRSCLHVAPPLLTSANGDSGGSEQEPAFASEYDFSATLRSLLRAYLEEGYPSSTKMAAMLDVSRRTLARRLEAEGTSFSALVDEVRFNTAKELLGNTRLDIAEISGATGFEDHSHFTRMFRRVGGITPAQFRKEVQGQLT